MKVEIRNVVCKGSSKTTVRNSCHDYALGYYWNATELFFTHFDISPRTSFEIKQTYIYLPDKMR